MPGHDSPAPGSSWGSFFSGGKGGFHTLQVAGNSAGVEQQPRSRNCPEEEAGPFAKVSFSYVNPLIRDGAKKHLQQDDLWDMARKDEAARVYSIFSSKLKSTANPDKPQGVVLRGIWLSHRKDFFWSGVLIFIYDIFLFMPPFILAQLLDHMAQGGSHRGTLGWAAAMLGAAMCETVTLNTAMHMLFRISLNLKTEMIQLLYAKSLRITSAVKADMGVGSIVNLQSNDAAKIWNMPLFMHIIWNGPFQILVVTAMLVRVMHWVPALSGLAVTLVMIPLSTWVGRALGSVRRSLIKQTDARVKLATEIITGIKAIKLYSWEDAYMERMRVLRDEEIKHIKQSQMLSLLNTAMFSAGPVCVALAAFATYSALGYSLTATVAFPALSLFNLLRMPIMQLPSQVMNMIQAHVGLQRIQRFVEADEMKPRGSAAAAGNPFPAAVVATTNEDDETPLLVVDVKASHDASHYDQTRPSQPAAVVASKARASAYAIQMCHSTFSWEATDSVTLMDITLAIKPGTLVMVVGQVGAGKSSLLYALLGEMHLTGGTVDIQGSVAYTSQDPWIQNLSLRDNILMGQEYEEERYTHTLAACALGPDLEMLTAGDNTEIGEKGVNLSGGQKHRVALARAVYSDADVFLLDDPLSAVDAHVGRLLFDDCVCGVLEGRTRVLVTHQLQYLPSADMVVVMAEGRVKEVGSYQALLDRGVDLNQFVKESKEEEEPALKSPQPTIQPTIQPTTQPTTQEVSEDPEEEPTTESPLHPGGVPAVNQSPFEVPQSKAKAKTKGRVHELAMSHLQLHAGQEVLASEYSRAVMRRTESYRQLAGARQELKLLLSTKEVDGKIIKVEERAVGRVDRAIYKTYVAAWSTACFLLPFLVVLLAFCERGLQVLQNYVLSFWTNDSADSAKEGRAPHTKRWLSLYFTLGMMSIVFSVLRAIATVAGSVSASRSLHKALMEKVVRLPMSFYDSQPTGRLLNRMTKDTESVDIQVSESVNQTLNCLVNAILSVLVVSLVTPIALVVLLPLAFVYYRVQLLYVSSSRELKRLDSLAFSPIFAHFSETLHGLGTIRAFDKQPQFMVKNQSNVDNSNRAYWPIQTINRWLSVRLEMMGALIVFVTAVSVGIIRPSSPGLVGLAISSALNLTGVINWMVRQLTELELNMNSVERMVEYLKYDEEAPAIIPSARPPPGWPHAGAIEARSLTVRYRPELDPVLRNLSFKVTARDKIGVCGRTGCGKSTLMMTLYRLIEPCGGTILIDGLDICTIGLRDLRSKLSLVPQDPVIFSGTIRSNLDPFDAVTADADVWEALRRAGMDDYVRSQEGGLSSPIKEGGANLSVGQRQLLCMARSLLRASRILVLDEATSNVDNTTDNLIQTTVRSAFSDCTVLTIAHRLHTIIDSDRVLVLDAGELAEYDTPHNLLQKPGSAFLRLVEETTKGGGLNSDVVADALAAARGAATG